MVDRNPGLLFSGNCFHNDQLAYSQHNTYLSYINPCPGEPR